MPSSHELLDFLVASTTLTLLSPRDDSSTFFFAWPLNETIPQRAMPSHFTISLSKPHYWVSTPSSIQYNCCAEVSGIKLHALSWFQLHVSNCLSMVLRLLKHRGQNVPCPSPYAHKLSAGAKLSITLSDNQSQRLGTFPFPVSKQWLNPSSSHKILLSFSCFC